MALPWQKLARSVASMIPETLSPVGRISNPARRETAGLEIRLTGKTDGGRKDGVTVQRAGQRQFRELEPGAGRWFRSAAGPRAGTASTGEPPGCGRRLLEPGGCGAAHSHPQRSLERRHLCPPAPSASAALLPPESSRGAAE